MVRRPFSCIIFDVDGTLVDSAKDIVGSLNFASPKLGRHALSEEAARSLIGDGASSLMARALGVDDRDLIQQALDSFLPHYLEHCVSQSRLYPGVPDVLQSLEGLDLAVVSNKPVMMLEKILKHFEIHSRFRVALGAESTSRRKPHPDPLLEILRELRHQPEETLMIGDGPNDVLAGKAAGTRTCAVTYGYTARRDLETYQPDFFIDQIADLTRLVKGGRYAVNQ